MDIIVVQWDGEGHQSGSAVDGESESGTVSVAHIFARNPMLYFQFFENLIMLLNL